MQNYKRKRSLTTDIRKAIDKMSEVRTPDKYETPGMLLTHLLGERPLHYDNLVKKLIDHILTYDKQLNTILHLLIITK